MSTVYDISFQGFAYDVGPSPVYYNGSVVDIDHALTDLTVTFHYPLDQTFTCAIATTASCALPSGEVITNLDFAANAVAGGAVLGIWQVSAIGPRFEFGASDPPGPAETPLPSPLAGVAAVLLFGWAVLRRRMA